MSLDYNKFDEKKYSCFFYEAGCGYGSYSNCKVYGHFKCDKCEVFLDKRDEKGVERYKMRTYVHNIKEYIVEIEDRLKPMKQFVDYILKHL